ncbi:MAG: hypothetical protein H6735_06790 [Alphaproteobacteria bacterium]|nr:hypothetical protein [Alphaproteobacteria bacterium]
MIAWVLAGCHGSTPTAGDDDDDVTTTDRYADISPLHAFEDVAFEGERVSYWIPDEPRAVLMPLHGSGGGFDTITQIDWIALYNLLEAESVAVVLTQSRDRVDGVWELEPVDVDNPDIQWLGRLRDHLVATTPLAEDTPVLFTSFSNGAHFVTRAVNVLDDEGWDIRAFSAHQGKSYQEGAVPGFFVSAENDETGATGAEYVDASERCEASTGVPCPAVIGTEIPLDPRWFARLPRYDEEQSGRLFDELVEMGIVDPDGRRLIDLADLEQVLSVYEHDSKAPDPSMVSAQLRVVWATHRFSSQHVRQEADFLLGRL